MKHKFIPEQIIVPKKLLEEQIRLAKKSLSLQLCSFSLTKIPQQCFTLSNLIIMDLSFNNIEEIPREIKSFKKIKQLFLNNNPLQFIPLEICELKELEVLKLSDTYIKFLPREMADLKKMYCLDMKNCPISGNFKINYDKGILFVMQYLQRKKDRSEFREKIAKKLKEWIYMGNSYEEIQNTMQNVMDNLKDANTADLKRLLRNLQNIFPLRIETVNPLTIRNKLFEKTEIKKIYKKDLFTVYE